MEKVGKYEIREQLGRGGMGTVYRAYDPVMEREVALKVILDLALDVPEIKERFYREARTAGKLTHENITVVHDVGEDNGRPFIVMEYLTGSDLRILLERHEPMTMRRKLSYAIQICRGLAYSHAKDIIHRDVKPANIRILENGRMKIMDFGIARLGSSALTSTGAVMGTPYYMSPEQIQGKKVDRRADIFSCGVLLFELFTSRKPFHGDEPTSVMYKIVHEEPEGLEELKNLLPPSLPRILEKMLKKDLSERFQTLDEAADALEEVQTILHEENAKKALEADSRNMASERLRGGSLQAGDVKSAAEPGIAETVLAGEAPPSTPPAPTRKPLRRGRIAVIALTVVVLASVAVFLYQHYTHAPTGAVAVNVLPWAQVAKIEREKEGAMALDKAYVTPCLLTLPEGSYTLTFSNPGYTQPMVLKCVVHRDSLSEVVSQWPGFDAEKAQLQF
jgi:eukaryotic-like serine/threonine-protein kinase